MPYFLLRATCLLAFLFFTIPSALGDFTNGGFETGDFSGWTVGLNAWDEFVGMDGDSISGVSSSYAPSYVNTRSGDYAAAMVVSHGSSPKRILSLSQTIMLEEGKFEIGFYLGVDAGGGLNPGLANALSDGSLGIYVDNSQVDFTTVGADLEEFGSPLPRGSEPDDMHRFASVFTATAGLALVEIRVSGSGSARVGLSLDDAYAIPVAGLAGDYNLDDVVDAADYAVWRDSLGDTGLTAYSGADGDGDTEITIGDYNVWRENFGMTPPASIALSQPAPEPVSATLASFFAIGLSVARRRSA